MNKKITALPIFSFLLGLFPLIYLWNSNKNQIYPRDTGLAFLLTAAFIIIVWLIFLLIYRQPVRASLGSSIVYILFFSFGHVFNLIAQSPQLLAAFGFMKLLALYILLGAAAFYALHRVRMVPAATVQALNLITVILMAFNLFQISQSEAAKNQKSAPMNAAQPSASEGSVTKGQSTRPDIYYIILDAYSRQDVLKKITGFDNSEFINALRDRGFYVADCANSNYNGTLISMSSSLNYAYHDKNADLENEPELFNELKNNRIRYDLQKFGYKFVTTKGYSSFNDIQQSDIYLNYLEDAGMQDTLAQSRFTQMYLETTLLRPAYELYKLDPAKYGRLAGWLMLSDNENDQNWEARFWYNQTKYVFSSLEKFPEKDGPFFVYAHINAPHGPIVFDRNGNFRFTPNADDKASLYVDTVIYLNSRVLELVDTLIKKSEVPPIIIIQGDHGAHKLSSGVDRNKILNAYYFPQEMKDKLYSTITPVNTFRLILRDLFHQNIDLLPDTVYAQVTNEIEPIPSTCDQ